MKRTCKLPDGRKLHSAEYGISEGEPLFYFHGFPGSHLEVDMFQGEQEQNVKFETVKYVVRRLTGDNKFIMDHLLEEALNMQSEEIKEFLIKTSILEQVSGELADFLLGSHNSQSILRQLEGSNMFIIPLDEQGKWYRYHHLFADLLWQLPIVIVALP